MLKTIKFNFVILKKKKKSKQQNDFKLFLTLFVYKNLSNVFNHNFLRMFTFRKIKLTETNGELVFEKQLISYHFFTHYDEMNKQI